MKREHELELESAFLEVAATVLAFATCARAVATLAVLIFAALSVLMFVWFLFELVSSLA